MAIALSLAGAAPAWADIKIFVVPTSLVEGVPYSGLVARFTYDCGTNPCPASSAFRVLVPEVAGSAFSTSAGDTPGVYVVTGTFTPRSDDIPTSLEVGGPDGSAARASIPVVEAPIRVSMANFDAAPGEWVSGIFSFTDTGDRVDATSVAWGDGSADACYEALAPGPIHAPTCGHSYSHLGTYTVTGIVRDGAIAVSGTGIVTVEPLVLGVPVPRTVHIRRRISFVVTPTVGATIDATGTLLVPGRHRGIRLRSSRSTVGHDQPTRVLLELSDRQARLLRAAERRHKRPSLRVRLTGTLPGTYVPAAVKSFRIPFAR